MVGEVVAQGAKVGGEGGRKSLAAAIARKVDEKLEAAVEDDELIEGEGASLDGELERLPDVSEDGGVAGGVETPVDDDELLEAKMLEWLVKSKGAVCGGKAAAMSWTEGCRTKGCCLRIMKALGIFFFCRSFWTVSFFFDGSFFLFFFCLPFLSVFFRIPGLV